MLFRSMFGISCVVLLLLLLAITVYSEFYRFFSLSIFLSKKQVSGNVIRIKKNFPTKLQNGHVAEASKNRAAF